MNQNYKYIQYASHRDVVFVLGAGASHPDGVPLQRHLLPMILSGKIPEIEKSEIGKQVIQFIHDNFIYKQSSSANPQLEAVFGFLDYFIQQNESLSARYTNLNLRTIKERLIKLIHYIVDLRTNQKSKYYNLFWGAIKKYNPNVSIITLNYDTLLEQAFEEFFRSFGYLDYCIHFMNYEKSVDLKQFNYWINPREPVEVSENKNPVPIKIIKLHGSLNWKYCNCCNQTLLTPWDRKIDLIKGKFLGYTYPEKKEYEYVCPQDGTEFETLIMPPSYIKTLSHPVISQLTSEASREIRIAKRIMFIGYSLSDADLHIKALFKKQLKDNVEVIVVNAHDSESLKARFMALSSNVKFITKSFEHLVRNEILMKELLS
ncbi:MAG: SIR2 family protein [bacterium]